MPIVWKWHRWEKALALTANDTKKIDLPSTGVLSAINTRVKVKNVSDAYARTKVKTSRGITEIKVVTGTDKVKFELTGRQARGVGLWDNKNVPPESHSAYGNVTQYTTIPAGFGRYQGDPEYALVLDEYEDAKLHITNTLTSSEIDTTDFWCDIDLLLAEEYPGKPKGWIKKYQWEEDTPDKAADYKKWELPSDALIRRILIQSEPDISSEGGKYDYAPHNIVNEIEEFSLKTGKITVLDDVDTLRLYRYNKNLLPSEPVVDGEGAGITSYTVDTDFAYCPITPTLGESPQTSGTPLNVQLENTRDGRIPVTYAATNDIFTWRATGWGYMNLMNLFDPSPDDPTGWLNMPDYKTGKIEIYFRYNNGAAYGILDVVKSTGAD